MVSLRYEHGVPMDVDLVDPEELGELWRLREKVVPDQLPLHAGKRRQIAEAIPEVPDAHPRPGAISNSRMTPALEGPRRTRSRPKLCRLCGNLIGRLDVLAKKDAA